MPPAAPSSCPSASKARPVSLAPAWSQLKAGSSRGSAPFHPLHDRQSPGHWFSAHLGAGLGNWRLLDRCGLDPCWGGTDAWWPVGNGRQLPRLEPALGRRWYLALPTLDTTHHPASLILLSPESDVGPPIGADAGEADDSNPRPRRNPAWAMGQEQGWWFGLHQCSGIRCWCGDGGQHPW